MNSGLRFGKHQVRNLNGMSNRSAFASGGPAAPHLNTVGMTNIYPCEDASQPGLREKPVPQVWCSRQQQQKGLWLLTAAPLTLAGADVSRGPPGQRPKQTPGEDQFASTLTWKGLGICRCSNVVLSSVSVIIYIWTYSCAAWFVSKIHQFFEIPFPGPSWQHTGISQQW